MFLRTPVILALQVGAGEWDRGSNPTNAKISLSQVFNFTNSHMVAFVQPLPPLPKGACALQVATQVTEWGVCVHARLCPRARCLTA
jgi:hypothetical protein